MFRREFWVRDFSSIRAVTTNKLHKGDAAGSARPDLLTPDIPTGRLRHHIASPNQAEEAKDLFGFLTDILPLLSDFLYKANLSQRGLGRPTMGYVASKEGPTPSVTGSVVTMSTYMSVALWRRHGMADLIGNSWDNDSSGGDINMQRSDAEGVTIRGNECANVMITEG
ncbi:hypothetical protein EDB92DRAFT_1819760, partial [Lactarius akahatsu]